MANKNKQPPGIETPEQMREKMEEWMKVAKPNNGIAVAQEYGMFVVTARGQFDLHETVVAVPIPFMLQVVGAYIAQGIAPMLAQLPVKSMDEAKKGGLS